jgi:hypothetical protein
MSTLTGTLNPAEHALNSAGRFVGNFPEQQFIQTPESPEVSQYAREQARYDAEFETMTHHPELQAVAEAATATELAAPASADVYRTPLTMQQEAVRTATAAPVENAETLDGRVYRPEDVQTEVTNAAHAIMMARDAVTREFSQN